MVEEDTWTFDSEGATEYLSLASHHDHYDKVIIQQLPSKELLQVSGANLTGLDYVLDRIGLFPRDVMTVDIRHDGQVIGRLIAYHRNMNFYVYFYAGVFFCLAYMVIVLFLKIFRAKKQVEHLVMKRTAELRNEIEERKKLEKSRRDLEAQLQRSEKMEVIGTLAGGVAHDLNNILGAIVGYPDLMLDGLPENSPLIKPLFSIKESGERAALIVQDLLTLARRGVAISEVENLNTIITRFLDSREFFVMKESHPTTHIETDLANNLLNVMGSSVHLSKLAMNLVSNAAEAMPNGGKININTKNVYLDRPVKGYDKIEKGDYVILSVSDEGVGISKEDLKRIFEPFYSKKVMGRSGTGLGMAVVWGTVKDHNGYIDIDTKEGVGTTFKIYLPVTRKDMAGQEGPVPIERYLGNGQKILIIDDVKEQRDIASTILEKLNYEVFSVQSGEEAIEYLKNNTADLLVLDMIMEQGLDGLDTYREIIKNNPAQRAIIASGYTQTERMEATQKLGAGNYVKKPYTLESIGMAVKSELDKS
ncbi:MAG: response regulator [Proteobacteria bacterium]|nr:response regulator [Pseudomonadota bacterium]